MSTLVRELARLLLPAALLTGSAGSALACIICLSAVSVTTAQKLDAADVVVLASPVHGGGGLQVTEVIKGKGVVGMPVEGLSGVAGQLGTQGGETFLLARNGLSARWTNLGKIGVRYSAWLRQLVATNDGRSSGKSVAWPLSSTAQAVPDSTNWPARIDLLLPQLESADPLVAKIAFEELARAPYDAMPSLKPVIEVEDVRGWINDPALAERRDAYLLLLGITGDADDAAAIERELSDAWASNDAKNLAALIAADLELGGQERIARIEKMYLTDPDRSVAEIEAALLALSVHGNARGALWRDRIVRAYRSFIHAHKPMAGFVVADLGAWKAWEAVPDLIDVLGSNAVKDPAGRFAIVVYLQESPLSEAHAAAVSAQQVN